jgi:hypothetical protein
VKESGLPLPRLNVKYGTSLTRLTLVEQNE